MVFATPTKPGCYMGFDYEAIPIIAMTANAFAEDVQASLDAGVNGHIAKPIVMEEVEKAIVSNVIKS